MVEIKNEDEILYQSEDTYLIKRKDELIFIKVDSVYHISSHPYEPCIYIKLDDKIIAIIHNSFNTSEIEDVARNDNTIRAITGKEYDIKAICELLLCAINGKIFDTDISYLENKKISTKEMQPKQLPNLNNYIKEITDDVFYKEYEKYDECVLDYCIVKIELDYNAEKSHKEAVLFAMSKWAKTLKDEYDIDITYDLEKMNSKRIAAKELFETSPENKGNNNSYMYLFLNPPHGCSYTVKDFTHINSILFPNGYDKLEAFEWSTNWSNYFDDGLEWWGARCISIYDNTMNRFVIIGASATD